MQASENPTLFPPHAQQIDISGMVQREDKLIFNSSRFDRHKNVISNIYRVFTIWEGLF